jgi:hypothetical protein
LKKYHGRARLKETQEFVVDVPIQANLLLVLLDLRSVCCACAAGPARCNCGLRRSPWPPLAVGGGAMLLPPLRPSPILAISFRSRCFYCLNRLSCSECSPEARTLFLFENHEAMIWKLSTQTRQEKCADGLGLRCIRVKLIFAKNKGGLWHSFAPTELRQWSCIRQSIEHPTETEIYRSLLSQRSAPSAQKCKKNWSS